MSKFNPVEINLSTMVPLVGIEPTPMYIYYICHFTLLCSNVITIVLFVFTPNLIGGFTWHERTLDAMS